MKLLKEYSEKFGIKEVKNDYGEHRQTREHSIIFSNGWVASIVENNGVDVYHPDGRHAKEYKSDKKYSVSMCDCLVCNEVTKNAEVRYCDDYSEVMNKAIELNRVYYGKVG